MRVNFNDTPVADNQLFSLHDFSSGMNVDVTWRHEDNQFYTVVMYDRSVKYLYYLLTNIPGNKLRQGKIVNDLILPKPTSGIHLYTIFVYLQPNRISVNEQTRLPFDLNSLVRSRNLKEVDSFNFRVSADVTSQEPQGGSRISRRNASMSIHNSSRAPQERSRTTRSTSSSKRVPSRHTGHSDYFVDGAPLNDKQKSYCACNLHVLSQQSSECLKEQSWGEKLGGTTCASPYKVCASSVGTTMGQASCSKWFDWDNIPEDEIRAYAELNNIPIPDPYNYNSMISNIKAWKASHSS